MLDVIVADTRRAVALREEVRPRASFSGALRVARRSLAGALRRGRTGFIFECKRRAPSAGELRPDLDVAAATRAYAPHADVISVLTNATHFGGAPADLAAAAAASPLPVLAKDFVVSPYQVEEARLHGADAVLLMLSVLDDAAWYACHATARRLGMETLTEAHDEAELRRALDLGAPAIGINNRDLRSMAVDLAVTERLAPLVDGDRLLVCESGIAGHDDVVRLRGLVDAFLVGTALLQKVNLSLAARGLVHGRTRVSGLTRPDDARAAAAAGATHGGLVFVDGSARRVSLEQGRALRRAADLCWTGIFAGESVANVAWQARELGLEAVEVRGDEDRAYVSALRGALPAGCEVWKRVRLGAAPPPPVEETGADRLLLEGRSGRGDDDTGRALDLRSLACYRDLARCLVAGGLTGHHAAAADRLGAWALDVGSGVEAAPGRLHLGHLADFLEARRGRPRTAGHR